MSKKRSTLNKKTTNKRFLLNNKPQMPPSNKLRLLPSLKLIRKLRPRLNRKLPSKKLLLKKLPPRRPLPKRLLLRLKLRLKPRPRLSNKLSSRRLLLRRPPLRKKLPKSTKRRKPRKPTTSKR